MNAKKIDSFQLIPLMIVIVTTLVMATIIRFIVLAAGADTGTANLVLVIVIGVCVIIYLVISVVVGESFIPWVMKKLPKPNVPTIDEVPISTGNDDPTKPTSPIIATLKEEAEKLFIARRTEKLNVFLEYTHLTVGPYVSAEGLERLRDCIARYTREEALPDNLTPIRTDKLSNFDLFHFGWNMAEYFDIGKKYEVVPWLQMVFANLKDLEPSYIKGKLYTSETKRFTIPNTTDLPAYLARLKG